MAIPELWFLVETAGTPAAIQANAHAVSRSLEWHNPNVSAAQQAAAMAMPAKPQPAEIQESLTVPMPIKEEPMASVSDGSEAIETSSANENNAMESDNGGKIPFKKIFQKRKKSSERTRDKKLRQNRQLRKSMLPKNALMALNEVKGINISDFTINSNPDGGFTAIVTVNTRQYEGKGPSKMAAKNLACEKALRDYIIAKMTPKPKKPATKTSAESDMKSEDENEPMDTENNENPPEDEVPMLNLASFAIYKLFAEWEREGYIVPEMHPSSTNTSAPQADASSPNAAAAVVTPKEPKKPPVRTELPLNWESMHPATLLCVMRPGLSYVDYGSIGEKPNVLQRLGVIVDNQEFTATGRSKKIARRNVAVNVCNSLFNTNFIYEEY
ncbi:PREDICTED: double-stranded RNA-specific editase 1 isoform X1 [Drosophila arizonae]|uniref:Double-stranded RNA-specific editase 1 isoform X1 n=1 Tax=Drosophila arizonae TaxID=7263 RepID=A0ABM1PUI4_DROAR|nr:PREDICTED: double-stranded RNA-specific editase 1 isoform X1 [Drosophila arizonae]XP_017870870.1 PREDICTED: double-stranded RNA-specific editase 1 isoform X1 [Drosophila arizonae]